MTADPLLALGEHPFLLVLDQLHPRSLFRLQLVSRTWNSFLSEHTGLWTGVLRREGVDLDEWRQVLAESKDRQRLAAREREKREALLSEALAEIGHDVLTEEGEPLIVSPDYQNNDPGPEAFMETEFSSTAAEYRAACVCLHRISLWAAANIRQVACFAAACLGSTVQLRDAHQHPFLPLAQDIR